MQQKMFKEITKTWNPYKGCLHGCSYCWARRLAEGKLKHTVKYQDGFNPAFFEDVLSKVPRQGFIFVSDMGDLFGDWVATEYIQKVLSVAGKSEAMFLFLTKNPKRYKEFLPLFNKQNMILGVTIETNRDVSDFSTAPSTLERYMEMTTLEYPRKMICIEPVMDFDYDVLLSWVRDIKPEFVYIGYDNYKNNLPEPSKEKVSALIGSLTEITEVRLKMIK